MILEEYCMTNTGASVAKNKSAHTCQGVKKKAPIKRYLICALNQGGVPTALTLTGIAALTIIPGLVVNLSHQLDDWQDLRWLNVERDEKALAPLSTSTLNHGLEHWSSGNRSLHSDS